MSPRLPFAALLALVSLSAAAAPSANSPFGDLHWRNIGPFRGGRVLAVTGVLQQPQHFYFGSVNGGVWESQDAGRTWQPIFDAEPVGSIGAIAVAPLNPRVIYVGSGESDMRSDIAQGNGVYKSTDAGKTWAHIGLDDSQQIGMIRVDPHDANRVFVAALGHPYGPNAQRGVFRSRDGGSTWTKVLGPNDATGAIDLAFDPRDANTLYAALWQVRRTPWNVYPPASGPGSGLYKSTDGGDHWTQITGNGFPAAHVGRIGIAISDAAPDRIYAIVDADAGGLYRSDDAGKTWKRMSDDARIWQRGWYFGQIAADPKNPDRVYAINTIVLRSDDGGKTFTPFKGDQTGDDYHELWIDPQNPQRQILGADQGAVVTVNGGATWSSWHNQSTAQMYHVSTDNRFPYRVYGAQQDSGAVGLPSRAPYHDRISMEQFHEVTAGGESGMVAPDPDDPDIVYGGAVDKLDLKTEQTHSVDPTLADPDLYRRTWTLPLVFNQVDHKLLYFGNQKIWRTADGGAHWDAISPDLTREDPGVPLNLDAVTAANNLGQGARRGVVYSIASSPLDAKLLWAGTDDGLVWRSADAGAHWDKVTPQALTPWSKIGGIEPSHFDASTVYIAVDRHRLDDRQPYIYRTRDAGKTWTPIVAGIRAGDFVNVVREDPKKKGLLYAGTELGVYLSLDDGDQWQPLQQNLPRTSVRDIDVKDGDLVIATHGRGFWIVDDIAALRQMDAKTSKPETRLFAPATAVRVRPSGFTGTPLPKDEPTAENPPWGAYIDYALAAASAKPIELSIYDANGALVRRYSSADAAPKLDLAKINATSDWYAHPVTLQTSPGLHRFVWPLRYPVLATPAHGDAYADGVWAPPGRYSVELKVDGKKYTQPLTVVADPRVKLAADAYAQQFDFAREVEALQARLAAANTAAGTLHGKLTTAQKGATGDLDAAIDELDAKVVAMAGIVDAPNPFNVWAHSPTSTSSFTFLDSAIGAIAAAADDADVTPSPDARVGFAKLRTATDAALHAWDMLRTHDLAALNAQLRKAGAKPIAVP
jgi:photosystem II stability/assembly factor-like uncharacterized protein